MTDQASITCPKCARVSHNENDIKHRFCSTCGYHEHAEDPLLPGPTAEAITKWIRAKRPDVLGVWEQLLADEAQNNRRAQSILAVTFVGFDAGREFERENPRAAQTPITHRFPGRHTGTPYAD